MSTNYHTPIAVAAPVNAAIVNAPLGTLDAAITAQVALTTALSNDLTDIKDGTNQFIQLRLNTPTTLTIAAGAVTVNRNRHYIDTEGAAATDDLTTMSGGVEGDIVRIQIVSSARKVVVKHGTGNILLLYDIDYTITSTTEYMEFMYDATLANWIQQPHVPIIRGIWDSVSRVASTLRVPDYAIRASGGWSDTNSPVLSLMTRPDKRAFLLEQASAATYASVGMAAGTNAGAGAVTNSNQTDASYVNQAIGAVAGTFGGRRSTTFNLLRPQYQPYMAFLMRTPATVTGMRFWIGACQAQVTNVDTLAINTSFCGFRYSTVAADPAWMAVTNDGVPAQTELTTGAGFAASTVYLFEIFLDSAGGDAYFSVNGSTPVSISTTLPPAADDMGWTCSAITTDAVVKNMLISRVYADWN